MVAYIHQLPDWPEFRWRQEALATKLAAVRNRQGRLLGRIEHFGIKLHNEAVLRALTEEVVKSSEIEGESLNRDQVRSSLARRLGIDIGALIPADRNVDGIVQVVLDATQNYDKRLTPDRLFGWNAALFPTGYSGMHKITVGTWRTSQSGPMQVVSGNGDCQGCVLSVREVMPRRPRIQAARDLNREIGVHSMTVSHTIFGLRTVNGPH